MHHKTAPSPLPRHFLKTPLSRACSHLFLAPLVMTTWAVASHAQEASSNRLEEVVVTAQKRAENLQDVPISVQALGQDSLDNLNISDFSGYVQQLPSVSFTQRRPGQANLFMRGISEGGNSNQSLQGPSVAIYLDNQPVTAIGFNLDPHVYDIQRIEVLMGPQGTLYGASSQAGTLRIVTNKPDTTSFDAGFDLTAETIDEGGNSYMAEAFVNIPLSDSVALRLVGYWDEDGGYIDAIQDTITFPLSGITRGNQGYVREDFNETDKMGFRAALGIDLSDSWTATASVMQQKLEADGVWDHNPEEFDDYEVSRFYDDTIDDEWTQFAVEIKGDLGFADLTYAGSYLDREFESYSDYSHYSIDGYVEGYYTCYVSYFGPCVDPSIQYSNFTDMNYTTHELRLSSNSDGALNWVLGAFYSEIETDWEARWSIPPINPGAAVQDDEYFMTDQVRIDEEQAVFGEIYYSITDDLNLTVGYRYFDTKTNLQGFTGTIWWPNCCYAFNGTRPPDNVDSTFSGSDGTGKINLAYNISDEIMIYGTWAEGYRPGGVNRSPGVGETYDPDFLTSYEFGWKTEWADGSLRFNGSIYHMEWDDIQIGFFNPEISLLGLVDNIGAAESDGLEMDVIWQASAALSLNLSYAYNKAELTQDYYRRPDATAPDAVSGQDLPFTPDNKYAIGGTYEFTMMGLPSRLSANYSYTDAMWNDIFLGNREKMDSYGLLGANLTVEGDGWHASLFGTNLTGEVAELYINTVDIQRLVTVNQPRTIGVSVGMRFD